LNCPFVIKINYIFKTKKEETIMASKKYFGGFLSNVPSRRNPMRTARLLSLFVVTVLLLASVPVGAQQPVAPPQILYGVPITLEQAKKVIAGAEAEAKKNNWNMVIVVLDSGGNLVMLERMDGTQLGSIEVAKDKAYSAVLFRLPTKVFQDNLAQGGIKLRLLKLSGAMPGEGGIPILVDGKVVGAVGVSGAAFEEDGQVAKAGADALTK
jgi:glc operon protein GlcG